MRKGVFAKRVRLTGWGTKSLPVRNPKHGRPAQDHHAILNTIF